MRHFSGLWMRHSGDFWGGLAAMLVALPASVAFGVTIYAAIAPHYAPFGALAGVIGAMTLGLIAPMLGGTDRLISAPCAPAAAVLSAFAIEMAHAGQPPVNIILLMTMLCILTGLIQILLGFLRIGSLIKYIPYPVVSGYLSGVGLIIIASQIPKFLGAADKTWFDLAFSPVHWDWRSVLIGCVTIFVTFFAFKVIKKVPATIIGILAGLLAYGAIGLTDDSLFRLENNDLVIGMLNASGEGYFSLLTERWSQMGELKLMQIGNLTSGALTLAALLSIDTLKTSVVLDQKTRTLHEPNRELVAQGVGNIAASVLGGIPGAGTMGASMVNLSSGGTTRISSLIEGALTIIAAFLLGSFVAWIPVATLSGVLIVVGLRMIDTDPLRFLESRSTAVDFMVVLAVIGVALTIGLVAASVTGVGLSVILFLREEVGGKVVRRKSLVAQRSSTWIRPDKERKILEAVGDSALIFELQGSLFFGTAQQLYLAIAADLYRVNYLIIDMQRVQSIDVTAAHSLNLIRSALTERNAWILLSNVPEKLANGRNLREFLELSGMTPEAENLFYMNTLEEAIEWVEQHLLGREETRETSITPPLNLEEISLFKNSNPETFTDLAASLEEKSYKNGDKIYSFGELDSNLYIVRKGEIRTFNHIGRSLNKKHAATFRRGDIFGTLAFLDGNPRNNDAIATRDTELFVLTRAKFDHLSVTHKRVAFLLADKLAQNLAIRLRHTEEELTVLQEG